MLITRIPQLGVPQGVPSQIGKHLARCYGFTENVHIPSLSQSLIVANDSAIYHNSWLREEYSQVLYFLLIRCVHRTYIIDKLRYNP
jgi:hypothetical protein